MWVLLGFRFRRTRCEQLREFFSRVIAVVLKVLNRHVGGTVVVGLCVAVLRRGGCGPQATVGIFVLVVLNAEKIFMASRRPRLQ
jgi:hypothetical protein